jgi:hypothetical protein
MFACSDIRLQQQLSAQLKNSQMRGISATLPLEVFSV